MNSPATEQPDPGPTRPSTPRRRRWRRWCWRVVLPLALLMLIPVGLVVHYTRPKNLTPLLSSLLSDATGGRVEVGLARLSWPDLLTLENVRVQVPDVPESQWHYAKLYDSDRIEVNLDLSALLHGVVAADRVRIERPQLFLVEDVDTGLLNLELMRWPSPSEKDEKVELRLPPSIQIEAARVHLGRVKDGQYTAVDTMRLAGELRENATQDRQYDFELRQYDASANLDTTLSGTIDTRAPALQLDMSGFSFDEAPHRQLLPAAFRAFWDEMDPAGQLPNLSMTMGADDQGHLRIENATLEMRGVALTPPYSRLGQLNTDPQTGDTYSPRMTQVNGRFVMTRDHLDVQDVTGIIEGIRYHASGRWSFAHDQPAGLTVSTDPFEVDKDPRFLAILPPAGLKLFERLTPSGRFQAKTRFDHNPSTGEVDFDGELEVLSASGRYHKFPYPLEDVSGVVTFNRQAVRIQNMVGHGPNGGQVTIRGEIAPPADGASVKIAIEARDMPFDEHVWQAFSPGRRRGIEMFFDPVKYQEMVDAGLVQPSVGPRVNNAPPAEASPPAFDLGGSVDLDVLVDRELGADSKYVVTIDIDPTSAHAVFRHWPYPLIATGGHIRVDPSGIHIKDLAMRGLTGGSGLINGDITQPDRQGPAYPDIRITQMQLPIDELLMFSIPEKQRQPVQDLHARGRVTGQTTVRRGADDPDTSFRIEGSVDSASASPHGGGFPLENIAAQFVLTGQGLSITDLTAEHGETTLQLEGAFAWAEGEPSMTIDASANDLLFDPGIVDLIDPDEPSRAQLETLLRRHQPEGIADAVLHVASREAADRTYRLSLKPRELAFDYRDTRVALADMQGVVTVEPDHVDLDQIAFAFPTGTASVDGLVGIDGQTHTAITLTAQADARCPYTRRVLPPIAVAVLDNLSVNGGYDLTDARLLVRPQPEAGQAGLEFDGHVRLSDTSLLIGVPVTQLDGELTVNVRDSPLQRWPSLSFDLRADHLRASDRLITPLRVTMTNHDRADQLSFDPLLGSVYGGVLVGSGSIPLYRWGQYRFDLTLSDVQVDPFLNPAHFDPTHRSAPMVMATSRGSTAKRSSSKPEVNTGTLSASLLIEAPLDGPKQERRGRGALLIRDASLYNRPISTALLRATSFTLPSGEPLDSASARYLIDGEHVTFDSIAFEGPRLIISGSGSMTYPDGVLNLNMVSRNKSNVRLGAVSDLIDALKDELIAIRVTGTLEEPQANVTSLRGLRASWQDVFNAASATLRTDDNLVGE